MGMDSFIVTSLNMFPKLILDLHAVCKNGDMLKAKNLQEQLSSAVLDIIKHGKFFTNDEVHYEAVTKIDCL